MVTVLIVIHQYGITPLYCYSCLPAANVLAEPQLPHETKSTPGDSSPHGTLLPTQGREYGRRYIIAQGMYEQMSNALNSLTQLAWLSASWNGSVVEPFIQNSHFCGFNDNPNDYYPFYTVFNATKFNEMLHCYQIPPLTTYDNWVKHGMKDVLVIVFLYDKGIPTQGLSYNDSHSDICDKHRMCIERVNRISKVATVSYRTVKCCCISAFEPTSQKMITEKCGISDLHENHTILIKGWRGISSTRDHRLILPEIALHKNLTENILYPFSHSVKECAVRFLRSFSKDKLKMLIHFRSENLVGDRGFYIRCMREIIETKNSILSSSSRPYDIIYMSDIGKYGSSSCRHKNCLKLMNEAMKEHNFTMSSFDPRIFGGLDNSMFVAAVEQEMMSMADELILVTGSGFHAQLIRRYLAKHDSDPQFRMHVHNLCM